MSDAVVRNNPRVSNTSTSSKGKKKLSKWVKRIIQPARETPPSLSSPQQFSQQQQKQQTSTTHVAPTVKKVKQTKVQWDQEPQKPKMIRTSAAQQDDDTISTITDTSLASEDSEDSDNASMAPLFSFCSSSVKSSTFSDMHSMQSTRPTVMSARTVETNSSTMAIPPASILDRARASSSLAHTSATPSIISSRPSSSKHFSLQRHNSSHTVNSIVTIKS